MLVWPAVAWAQNAELYVPKETVAFEDVPTFPTDYDVNDMAFRYSERCVVDGSGNLLAETIYLSGVSAGADATNALWLDLDGTPSSVTVDLGTGPVALGPSGSSVEVLADFRDLFAPTADRFVNTLPAHAIVTGRTGVVQVDFTGGPNLGGTCPQARFVLKRPSDGVVIDGSSTLSNGEPLTAHFPGTWLVPTEHTPLWQAYPRFLTWLQESIAGCPSGCPDADWYTDTSPRAEARPALDVTAPLPDQPTCSDGVRNQDETAMDCGGSVCAACVFASCADYLVHGSTGGNGTYTIDAGTGTPFEAWCDMDGGGWTLLSVGGFCSGVTQYDALGASDACGFLRQDRVAALAAVSADVRLTGSTGGFVTSGAWNDTTTSADGLAVQALLTPTGTWHNGATWNTSWRFEFDATDSGCASPVPGGATGWPNMFHGCAYFDAVHWLFSSTFQIFQQPQYAQIYPTTATWIR